MSKKLLNAEQIRRALELRDLTDVRQGPHGMQNLVTEIVDALALRWKCDVLVHREPPIVSVRDNYDRLAYPPDGIARDERYTRYINDRTVLRTHTSAMVPRLLERIDGADVLLVCPGLVYRRDAIDRLHTGEPHQLDLWRVRRGAVLGEPDLIEMVRIVVEAALPSVSWSTTPADHPYTVCGLQIDAGEVEIGECGLASPVLLHEGTTGLAMGLGLDRLLMLRKGLDDIRALRATDPRIANQMLDLLPYQPVSRQPSVTRDLSIAVAASDTVEDLGDRVRAALGGREVDWVETVEVLSETPYDELPPAARERLCMSPNQKNVLVRVVLRHMSRALTRDEANVLRDRVYDALHLS